MTSSARDLQNQRGGMGMTISVFYRGQAEFIRERDHLGNALVLFKDKLVQGWSIELPNPVFEEDGLVAVDSDGRVFILHQGTWDENNVQLALPLTFSSKSEQG